MYESGNELAMEQKEKEWTDRSIYAEILKEIILSQQKIYNQARDTAKKNKISHSIAYLIQVQNSIINSEKNIEARIEKLEELTKLT